MGGVVSRGATFSGNSHAAQYEKPQKYPLFKTKFSPLTSLR
jgi:hypothetical protein